MKMFAVVRAHEFDCGYEIAWETLGVFQTKKEADEALREIKETYIAAEYAEWRKCFNPKIDRWYSSARQVIDYITEQFSEMYGNHEVVEIEIGKYGLIRF